MYLAVPRWNSIVSSSDFSSPLLGSLEAVNTVVVAILCLPVQGDGKNFAVSQPHSL